ncbi:MAG TPA: PAS domain S-box protein [Polyangiaceae bacterium]
MVADGSILVVDDDAVSRHVLGQTLASAGLATVTVGSGGEAMTWLQRNTPSLVLLDLIMPDPDGYVILKHIRAKPNLAEVPVVVLTALDSDEEIQRVFSSGADDYVHKPFRPAELVARIRGQMRMREYVERLNRREHDQQTVLELTQALASSLDIRDILFTVVQRVADVAHVDRCSIVLVGEPNTIGFVVATSDDEQLRDLPIDLAKYPEIREVLSTGRALVIRDAARHPLFEVLRQSEPPMGFSSLALMPILHEHGPMGVVFLRSRRKAAFADHEMALVHTVANATAIALRNARILQSLRDETQQSTFARVEAERRVQLFQRYADFFESAADGMVVIDGTGRVLFANPRAREITGFSESELVDLEFYNLTGPGEHERAQRLLRGFREGIYPRGVDIALNTKDGQLITISVSFSSVLHEDNAVLFTFRDVTVERKTAIELQHTKEFLERVIESSVDAIVSADMRGQVLLFNRAAARIFGYQPSDVIGTSVEKLYPGSGAREVMRRIRDPNVNGPGRLEDYRVDMVSVTGEVIAVKLSAALIFENGKPVGSVGIFTDIRDKLRMEARLLNAQEELRNREKQAIVAELAGAAAHELNQPLTSVIGYAELLRRNLQTNKQLHNAATVILGESERMAEIVRKIGKITKYETKSYVGGAKILDLEKASEVDASGKDVRR